MGRKGGITLELLEADKASKILKNLEPEKLQVIDCTGNVSDNYLDGWFVNIQVDEYLIGFYMEGKNIISLEYLRTTNEIIFGANKIAVIDALPSNVILCLEDAVNRAVFPTAPKL